MKYRIIPVTPFQQNCTLIWCEKSGKGAVVDPGGEIHKLLAAATEEGIALERILVTHGHIDHAGGAAEMAEQTGLPIEGPHKNDAFWINELDQQALSFGMLSCRPFTPSRWLEDGNVVSVGKMKLDVLHCPGHTPGHVAFFHQESKLALVGDILFRGSIGRTDFPKGNQNELISSIQNKLWPLGDDVQFISGHGEMSTFGEERKTNPFVGE